MAEDTELELLITVVVSADDERTARESCTELVRRIGGRFVESTDCSDEEPGCWAVTIGRTERHTGDFAGAATLSRAVRNFLRELGPDYARHHVSCEPPTAWTVVDNAELVGALATGGERVLAEAWVGGMELPATGFSGVLDPDDDAPPDPAPGLSDVDEDGTPRARLRLLVDVVTERRSGAEWPARALASRLSRTVTILDGEERPPVVRMTLDLGPVADEAGEAVSSAMSALGGSGWSRLRVQHGTASVRWTAAPTPPSGVAALELSAGTDRPDAAVPDSPGD